MIQTLVYRNGDNIILNGKQIDIYEKGQHRIVSLKSKGILVYKNYVGTEDKEIIEIREGEAKVVSRVEKTPTCIGVHGDSMYITDRLGSVYEIKNLSALSSNPTENAPCYLFGSISMITSIRITDDLIITADKDSKIRLTEKAYPHRIRKFVLVHSKPLTTAEIFGDFLLAGGYDWYVSFYNMKTEKQYIFDLEDKKIKEIETSLPGVKDLSQIPNINLESECRVRKILVCKNTALLITSTGLLLLCAEEPADIPAVSCKEVSIPSDTPILDGVSTEDGYEIIDQDGALFRFTLEKLKPVKQLTVPNYTHTIDISIANKQLR